MGCLLVDHRVSAGIVRHPGRHEKGGFCSALECYNDGMQVVALSEVAVDELSPILQEELRWWRDQLFWNYEPAAALIRKYVSWRTLPGFALRDSHGRMLGYAYYVIDHPVGYLGNLYIRSESASNESYRTLLEQTVAALKRSPEVQRIESQVFDFNCDLVPLFLERDFVALRRHFLCLDTEALPEVLTPPRVDGFRVLKWNRKFLAMAAQVVCQSYAQSPDFQLCRDYQSHEGCMRFLRNLVDNPGCGSFSQDMSFLAFDEDWRLCGVLITSRIDENTGMIPQISVRPDSQGRGLGTALLKTYFAAARNQKLKHVTLSVSEANRGALALYRRLGFQPVRDFHAFIWIRQGA